MGTPINYSGFFFILDRKAIYTTPLGVFIDKALGAKFSGQVQFKSANIYQTFM